MPLPIRSEEHTSELQSPCNLVCRLLLEKKKKQTKYSPPKRLWQTGSLFFRNTVTSSTWLIRPVQMVRLSLNSSFRRCFIFFFFNDTATPEIYTLSLHDALPI